MRIGVVFNPRSGWRRGDSMHREIRSSLARDGHDAVFLDVDHRVPLEGALREMIPNIDALAVVGGDGTLNGVINAVLTSSVPKTPVAFFPTGRGKDTARSIPSFSLRALERGSLDWQTTHRIDVIRASMDDGQARFLVNASDVGLSGAASWFASKLPRHLGATSYVLGGVYGFLVSRPAAARLTLDGNAPIELQDVLSLIVCNGKAFGGGLHIAPDAQPDDGQLDVIALGNANLLDLLANLPKLKRGTLRDHPALTRWQAREVRIDASTLGPIDVDGEIWGELPMTYTTHAAALNWIGPRS